MAVKRMEAAIADNNWGKLQSIFDEMVENGYVRWKDMAAILPKLQEIDADHDDQVLKALKGVLYFWAENMSDDGVKAFLACSDHYIELTDEDYGKAGRAYESLHIHVIENSGCVAPEGTDPDEYWLLAAECYLKAESMRADECLKKLRNRVKREDGTKWIRFKSAQSRVQDRSRRYGGASYAYLSTLKDAESLNIDLDVESKTLTLNNAAICAILDKHGPPRTAVLKEIKSHPLSDTIPVSNILSKVSNNEIVTPKEVKTFEKGLAEHHRAKMPDGRTIVQNAMIRHNISVVASIYKRVSLKTMASILGVAQETDAERVITEMINKEGLKAIIDGVDGTIEFNPDDSALIEWEDQISEFCKELDLLCNDIDRSNAMQVA